MSTSSHSFDSRSPINEINLYRPPAFRRLDRITKNSSIDDSITAQVPTRKAAPNLDHFFHHRMNSSSSSIEVPHLDLSHSSEDDYDELFLSSTPNSPSFSKYRSPHSSFNSNSINVWSSYTPLDQIAPPQLLQFIQISPDACSSCGDHSTSSLSRTFVQLRPCGHLLCSRCVNSLVNDTSNDPPRPGNCYACDGPILTFVGVEFIPESKTEVEVAYSTPTKLAKSKTPDLSPFRKLDWSTEVTPPTSSSSRSSTRKSNDSNNSVIFSVVRVDNVPWNLSIAQVQEWFPNSVNSIPFDINPLSIHILCNRADGKTLNQLYLELPTLEDAHLLIRLRNGKRIIGRPVSVGLSSPVELVEMVFPGSLYGGNRATGWLDVQDDGVLITTEDLEGLVHLCKLETAHPLRCPERAFLNIITILLKLPWNQRETRSENFITKIFRTVEAGLIRLMESEAKFSTFKVWKETVDIMVSASLTCSAFGSRQKKSILEIAGLASTEPEMTSISTPSPTRSATEPDFNFPLRSPTFDRVRSSDSSPSPPRSDYYHLSSPSPIRQQLFSTTWTRESILPLQYSVSGKERSGKEF